MTRAPVPPHETWIAVALLGKPRGNRGELTAASLTSHPERFETLRHVYLFGDGQSYTVERIWTHGDVLIFKFLGVDSISDAETLTGSEVCVPASERIPPAEGEYYHSDLIGCAVFDRLSQRSLGAVIAFQEMNGPGLLELEGGELIPFTRELCKEIDTSAREIHVDLPEGLLDLNRP